MANDRKSLVNIDPGTVSNQTYNRASGAQKNTEVGQHLKPITFNNAGTIAFTTDASTARSLPSKGRNLAVYNNAVAIGAVTLGDDSTMAALAAGVTDATGNVGIPCAPGAWTYIACNNRQWVKSTAATLLVFVIEDDTVVA
jgi:hypothetical protein